MRPALRKALVCVVVAASVLASGCGTTAGESTPQAGTKLHGPKAQLKIYRTQEFITSGVAADIRVDGRKIASLGIGGSILLDVPAGSRKIVVDGWGHPNSYSMTLHAKAGMSYVLEVSPRSEPVAAGILFGLVGAVVEAVVNENDGPFQIRVAETKPLRR